jgi:hypothetical protein
MMEAKFPSGRFRYGSDSDVPDFCNAIALN